jgi:hypothetical protein
MAKVFVLAILAAAGTAQAQLWVEIPDAPAPAVPAPAPQTTVGVGPLTMITGGANFVGDSVDSFCIYVPDPSVFSATTVGGATFDTQLFLFSYAPSGMGVSMNDDSAATLQSTVTGAFMPGPGLYGITISRYDADPSSAGGPIWLDTPFGTERAPDGPGAAGPVTGWSAAPDLGSYTIRLTGAFYCEVPSPGALALLGLGGLVAARRRR